MLPIIKFETPPMIPELQDEATVLYAQPPIKEFVEFVIEFAYPPVITEFTLH